VEFVEVEMMLLAVYYFRFRDDVFSITVELKIIAAATFMQCLLNFYGFGITSSIYLVQCVRDILVITASNVMPVLHSYRKESDTFPTPEMLENFTLTLNHAKALLSFRRYLKRISASLEDDASAATAIATADQYLFFLVDTTDLETRRLLSKATHIQSRYLVSGLFTKELRHSAEEGLDGASTVEQAREALEPLVQFARERLEYEFFPMYKNSEVFGDMQRDAEQFLRLRQRESLQNQLSP